MTGEKALNNIAVEFDEMGMICSNIAYKDFWEKDLHFKEIFDCEYEIIMKDLKRLETLEEENEELKTKLAVLEGVNQAFRETAIECNKLKQAISILKDIFEVVLCESDFPIPEIKYSFGFKFRKDGGAYVHISRVQYELLKQVFESVGDECD